MSDSSFEHTYAALPPELKKEVKDFAEFLLAKRSENIKAGSATHHPLAQIAGVWRNETLRDEDLLPKRTLGRELDL
jgi:hypothetical protein